MLPTIAIVGRPNVGKSTLFNALTKTRDALVADQPGLTRDRKFGRGIVGGKCWLIDTGGLGEKNDAMLEHITQQAWLAVEEADSVLFLVDGRSGLTAADENLANKLRRLEIPVYLVINKAEGVQKELISAEFYRLGLQNIHVISAAHQRGITDLMLHVLEKFPTEEDSLPANDKSLKIAVLGRPNVGKSTLINRLLGYERVITFDQPGTTRDSIFIPLERDGKAYTLIDTAGIRKRSRIFETIEKFSVIKALQAINSANVVIMLADAKEGMTVQDTNLLGHILDSGRGLIIAVNKWDGLSHEHRKRVQENLDRKLHFIDFAKIHFISALHGTGVGKLLDTANNVWHSASRKIHTPRLNHVLQDAIKAHAPPLKRGRRIKLRYINQAGTNPPLFIIHGNQVSSLPNAYQRYLKNYFRDVFKLEGTPIHLEFKQSENPFAGRKNTLNPRQIKKKQRLMKHVKK
ncbi:ribosome biogenesis GTPase Der [Candidatus Halobeggiatoa sp. HSG11]|nr:ribosome biogenesis GTPase Der [Candidatus Halobeggiatoa sp. HSG11]